MRGSGCAGDGAAGIGAGETDAGAVIAYLGLGTNLGDRRGNLAAGLRRLSGGAGLRLLRISRVYETEPWGVTGQPRFLNCAAEFAVTLEPEALLACCQAAERAAGRRPGPRWGPRVLDVDLLLYGGRAVALPHLEIPHPRLHLRAFALAPLAELAPGLRHPIPGCWGGRSVGELARDVAGRDGVVPADPPKLAVGGGDC